MKGQSPLYFCLSQLQLQDVTDRGDELHVSDRADASIHGPGTLKVWHRTTPIVSHFYSACQASLGTSSNGAVKSSERRCCQRFVDQHTQEHEGIGPVDT